MSETKIDETQSTEGTIMYVGNEKIIVPPPPKYQSIFERFYYIEDGVISFSLKDMTTAGTLAITGFLIYILVASCT